MNVVSTLISTNESANNMVVNYTEYPPDYAAFDTETSGLHIIYDKPFLFQFGWVNMDADTIFTYVVDLERQPILAGLVIQRWHKLVRSCAVYAAHNVKYDLNILINIGLPYEGDNITDGMIYIRAAMDNIPTRSGGTPLQLKAYCARYIDPDARYHDKLIQSERSSIAKAANRELQQALNSTPPPEGQKSWSKSYMDKLFGDVCFNLVNLKFEHLRAYAAWSKELDPRIKRNMRLHTVTTADIPYDMVDRDLVIRYGHIDVVLLLKLLIKLDPIIRTRKTMNTVEAENRCIYPLLRMERVGFKVDTDYLNESVRRTRNYIAARRETLAQMVGKRISIGQHAVIKDILLTQFGVNVASTGSDAFNALSHQLVDGPVVDFINIIQELRTLEKWIAVYMQRFQIDLRKGSHDRIYTQVNQVGTASGRVTSDFQQFPKKGIKDSNGDELFHPRRMILSEGKGLLYLDYSQIELRLQALYTILVGTPDLNLCRAYMPYKCHSYHIMTATADPLIMPDPVSFDYNNPMHIANWERVEWHLDEDPTTIWAPVDLHGATAEEAFQVTPEHPQWATYRGWGKRMNFMKNYGGGITQTKALLINEKYTDQEILHIDGAYYRAFPGVKEYQNYCQAVSYRQSHAVNLLGIKYYGVSGHNLINMLIQGSGAFFLKEKICLVDEYLRSNGHSSRFQMNIHDELSFIWHDADPFSIFYDIKKIMEEWDGCMIPIVADMEITTTNWAEKEDVET